MRREFWWILIALLVLAISVWLYFSLEFYEKQVYKAQSREAIANPFLAAQRYLRKRGVDIQEPQERLNFDLIPHDDIVILSHADALLVSDSQIEKAVSWIKRGGFLVVGVEGQVEGHSSIFKHYGVDVEIKSFDRGDILVNEDGQALNEQETEDEINRRIKNSSGDDSDEQGNGRLVAEDETLRSALRLLNIEFDHSFYAMDLSDIEDTLYIAVLDRVILDHADLYQEYDDQTSYDVPVSEALDYTIKGEISDDYGTRLLQISDGQGSLTALSSTKLWRNKNIGLGDHARLLSYFVPDGSRVHLFFDIQAPTLTELAKKYVVEVILGLCLFLFFWLWHVSTRVLQQKELQPQLGRNFGEHLKAGAKFMAIHKQYEPILQSINDDIEVQMRRYHLGFSELANVDKAKLIHTQTALNEDAYAQWINLCNNIKTEYDFVHALKLGQAIRNKL